MGKGEEGGRRPALYNRAGQKKGMAPPGPVFTRLILSCVRMLLFACALLIRQEGMLFILSHPSAGWGLKMPACAGMTFFVR